MTSDPKIAQKKRRMSIWLLIYWILGISLYCGNRDSLSFQEWFYLLLCQIPTGYLAGRCRSWGLAVGGALAQIPCILISRYLLLLLIDPGRASSEFSNQDGYAIIALGILFFFMSAGMVISLITYGIVIVISDWRDSGPRPKGLCKNCEYDQLGNVSGICPECGTPLEVVTAND